jgi:membrane-associated phospholipid phosphatase
MAELEGKGPVEQIGEAAQHAAAAETAAPAVRRRRATRFEIGLLVLILAFAGLTFLVTTTSTQGADVFVTHTLQTVSSPLFSSLMAAISWPGYTPQAYIIALLIVLALYGLGLRWEAGALVITGVLAEALDLIVKDAVRRARPSDLLVHVATKLGDYSFPSGHVTFYTAFIGFLWFLTFSLLKRSWKRTLLLVIFGALIVLVGVSRMYLGEHWASDVLGGYLLGSLSLMIGIRIYRAGKARGVPQPVAPETEGS